MMKFLFTILLVFCNVALFGNDGRAADHKNSIFISKKDSIQAITCKWYFTTVDSIYNKDPAVEISGWDSLPIEFPWHYNKKYLRHYGNVWFRLPIFISKDIRDLALYAPIHYRGAQFYFNGQLIYETRPYDEKGYSPPIPGKPEIIRIPDKLIADGYNVLSVRSRMLDNTSGFNKPVHIGSYNRISNKYFFALAKTAAFCAILIFIAIYFMFFYFYKKSETYYSWFSLMCFNLGIWFLGFTGYSLYIADSRVIYNLVTYIGSISIPITLLLFIHSFLKIPSNIVRKIFLMYYGLNLVFAFLEIVITGGIFYFHQYFYAAYISSINLLLIYLIVITARSIHQKTNYSWRILCGLVVLLGGTALGVLDFLNVYRIEWGMMEGFFVMILMFTSALASHYAKVHRDLEKAHTDLLVLDRMKDDFLATTTHELRTPLHGIIGIAESLSDGSLGEVSMRQKENLDLITSSATRLNDLVTSILDFSKLRAGRADLYIEELSLGDIINSAVSLMQPVAREKNIALTAEIGEVPRIKADRNRTYQVMLNLLGNAIKFTERGSIAVKAGAADKGGVRVSVADTGIGIGDEDMARIWSPFTQAEAAEKRTADGTGLGLAITKHLVELHGGAIWAESEKGTGSVFTFELPSEPPGAGITMKTYGGHSVAGDVSGLQTAKPDAIEFNITVNPSVAKATILAVDDDPVGLRILENLCSSCGHRLITTATGPAALDIIERRDVDLVLLDLMLPGMSGYEVCEKMRQSEKGSAIPVIMLTALDQAGHMARGFRTGANDYITKPFKRYELMLRIENQLAIKQMLEMEQSVINGLRKEKDAITGLFQRSMDIKESAIQMHEWEKIIQDDLLIARAFQQKLMTRQEAIAGFETGVLYRPLLDIGGDVYDIFELRPGVVRAFIADATGHGINASLNTVKILSEYAAVKGALGSPAEIINFLNQRFTHQGGQSQLVFTGVVADIDLASSVIIISTAGVPAQFLLKGSEVVVVNPRNPIVGLSNKINYKEETHSFKQGDTLFLYTDGLAELAAAKSDGADEFELIADALAAVYPGTGLDEAGEKLVQRFAGGGKKVMDDVTIVSVRRVG